MKKFIVILQSYCMVFMIFLGMGLGNTPAFAESISSVAPAMPSISAAAWPYVLPSKGTVATPGADYYGAQYLPQLGYLPWLGQSLSMLVNYSDFFYNLEKHVIDGSTAPYNAVSTAAVNPLLMQKQATNATAAAAKTAGLLSSQLTFDSTKNIDLNQLAFIPGTDIGTPCVNNQCPQNPPSPNNNAFNMETLLSSLSYPASQNQDIDHLIIFVSNLISPFKNPGLSADPATLTHQLTFPTVQTYVLNARMLTAMQSMVLSNLHFLAQERQIVPGLGTQASMVTTYDSTLPGAQPIKDASQLQLDDYLINSRLNNPTWYAKMNVASSEALQRETLFVLMEMQRQLFQMRLLNERVLATLSLIQTGNMQMNNQLLSYQFMQAQNALNPNANTPTT